MHPCQTVRLRKRAADLPVMSVRVHHAAQAPAMFLGDWIDLRRAGGQGAGENSIGIGHGQNDAHRTAAESVRTEVEIFGRLSLSQNSAPCTESRATTPPPPSMRNTSVAPKEDL